MKTPQLVIAGLLAAVSIFAAPGSASAEERVCHGGFGAITLDNVRVPPNASCTLRKTRVKGTVKVERGASLNAIDVIVIGNVQGENAQNVSVVQGSRVGGSVQVVQGWRATVSGSRIDTDILFDSNNQMQTAARNVVDGNIQAFQNREGVTIRGNRVGGNLQCKASAPAPTGGNNTVQGNKEDQCRRL